MKTRNDTAITKRGATARGKGKKAAKDLAHALSERASRSASPKRRGADTQGQWMLEGVPSSLVVVEGRRIAAGNRRFRQLARRNASASFQPLGPDLSETERPRRGLLRLLVDEVSALPQAPRAPVTRLYRRVGREQFLEATYFRSSPKGDVPRAVVTIHEATARIQTDREMVRMREALIQNERMRAIGELASGVAHDLNNSLHAMSLRLSLIEQSEACRTAQGSNITALSRALNDAALVVGRLQDFARHKTDRSLDHVDVSAVASEAIEMVRTTIEGESSLAGAALRIRTDLPPLPVVKALASDVRHVVVNLLLNARDAMPKGGTIEVVTEQRDGRVILEVKDEGNGIPEKDLENIFSPFFTTKGTRGTGLGLSNARTVLARVGAEISASNRPSGGACFTLSFPIATSVQSSAPPRHASDPPRGRRILIVDDNRDNLQAAKMVMELHEQWVDVAQTGSEAIARLAAGSRYDLVFCDLGMPDMNGWRIAQEIQELAPGTAVYMLTGWTQHIQKDDPRRRLVRGVLQKPMTPETIRDLLADEWVPSSLR